jgi:hypothetical protein
VGGRPAGGLTAASARRTGDRGEAWTRSSGPSPTQAAGNGPTGSTTGRQGLRKPSEGPGTGGQAVSRHLAVLEEGPPGHRGAPRPGEAPPPRPAPIHEVTGRRIGAYGRGRMAALKTVPEKGVLEKGEPAARP